MLESDDDIKEFEEDFSDSSDNKNSDDHSFILNQTDNILTSQCEKCEWIPYNQFYDIKEINEIDSATEYSAIWENGPLYYDDSEKEWSRYSDENMKSKNI
ncbi:unnamed protein product [Rhizophagus irregularis]|nr:unnamed protein product [Rhizophagus irregularis]